MTELRSYGPTTESTKYSEFPLQAWEPKVQLPYKTEPGCIPRKIEVERRKRSYTAQNIVALLTERGTGIRVQGLQKPLQFSLLEKYYCIPRNSKILDQSIK